jgi:hypothetical protein
MFLRIHLWPSVHLEIYHCTRRDFGPSVLSLVKQNPYVDIFTNSFQFLFFNFNLFFFFQNEKKKDREKRETEIKTFYLIFFKKNNNLKK